MVGAKAVVEAVVEAEAEAAEASGRGWMKRCCGLVLGGWLCACPWLW